MKMRRVRRSPAVQPRDVVKEMLRTRLWASKRQKRTLLPANLAISERNHCARSATSRANSTPPRTRQHVAASPVVPTHKVGLDNVLSEQHCHRIVDMSGRYVPVRVHALQSFNKSLFECVDHHVFLMIQPGRLLQGLSRVTKLRPSTCNGIFRRPCSGLSV
jgi:hypothetical protein